MTIEHAFQLHQQGRLAEAERIYRDILARDPNQVDALHLLGVLANQAGQHQAALDLISRAVALKPDYADFHINLGVARQATGDSRAAADAYRRAIELNPKSSEAHSNLAHALLTMGEIAEAEAHARRAVQLDARSANGYINWGSALRAMNRPADAANAFTRAIEIDPNGIEARNNLGCAYIDLGAMPKAIEALRGAIAKNPNYAEAYNNLAVALRAMGKLVESEAAAHKAVELRPDYAEAVSNRGNVLMDLGRQKEAIACAQKAVELMPQDARLMSNLLYARHFLRGDPEEIFCEHQTYSQRFEEPLLTQRLTLHIPRRKGSIRIGYVSPDFRDHPVARFLLPLLANRSRETFQVFGYHDHGVVDSLTERIRHACDHWRVVNQLSNPDLATRIRDDEIDVLVDLSGHTARGRLLTFAQKPAPVQVTYLGYPDTTGLNAMDFRITDALSDPPGMTERFHTEKLIRLKCAWCYQIESDMPDVAPLPAATNGYVTFGCFNIFSKVNKQIVALWARILSSVENSVLILKSNSVSDDITRAAILDRLASWGLERDRVRILGRQLTTDEHLSQYHHVDIALDTFPYHGTTTTCESLAMGVPVVTLAGQTHASRVGVSLLSHAGLADLVAENEQQYVDRAVKLARDIPLLRKARTELRANLRASALCDAVAFAADFEQALVNIIGP